jgi:hypothetical protein
MGFEFGASHKAGTLLLKPHLESLFALVILRTGSLELLAQAGMEP